MISLQIIVEDNKEMLETEAFTRRMKYIIYKIRCRQREAKYRMKSCMLSSGANLSMKETKEHISDIQ